MEFTLEEICSFINGGAWSDTEYAESGIHVVKVTNIVNGMIVRKDDSYLPLSKYETYKSHKLRYKDIIVATVGSHPTQPGSVVGRTASVSKEFSGSFLNQNAVCLRVKRGDLVNQTYLYYLSKTILFKHHIESRARGSANQVRMALGELKKFRFNYPPLPVQEKVAAILSAYDDLIENNKRRIALLEKMAEEIYREWFVRMRFPGHEKAKFEKGVPEGWEIKPSVEIVDVLSGGTPKTDVAAYWDGDIPFFTPKDANENFYTLNTEKNITTKGLTRCNSQLFKKNTIFITARGTVGKLALAYRDMAMNQSCYALVPKNGHKVFFYYLSMRNAISYVKGISKSGVFDNIIIDTFRIIPILMPVTDLIDLFHIRIEPIFQQVGYLLEKNDRLSEIRNRLLGRLISGKLPVENLDIQCPPSMIDETEDELMTASAKEDTDAQPHHGRRHRAGDTKEAKA